MSYPVLHLIVGPSGSGKTTLLHNLLRFGFKKVLTTTTRPPREGETAEDYNFVSLGEFQAMTDLVEYDLYNGYYYGTTMKALNAGDIAIVTPEGMRAIKRKYTKRPVRVIGLFADVEELERRLTLRGDTNMSRLKEDIDTFKDIRKECDCAIMAVNEQQTLSAALFFAVRDNLTWR